MNTEFEFEGALIPLDAMREFAKKFKRKTLGQIAEISIKNSDEYISEFILQEYSKEQRLALAQIHAYCLTHEGMHFMSRPTPARYNVTRLDTRTGDIRIDRIDPFCWRTVELVWSEANEQMGQFLETPGVTEALKCVYGITG